MKGGLPPRSGGALPASSDPSSLAFRRACVVQGGVDRVMDVSFVDEFAVVCGGVREGRRMAAMRAPTCSPAPHQPGCGHGEPVFASAGRYPHSSGPQCVLWSRPHR